jgi:hypothetical protein
MLPHHHSRASAMRIRTFLAPLLLLAACSAQAATARPQVSAQQCDVSTSYDVLADSGGIWLRRKQGVPREIFFHGGELNIDRQPQAVSAADAQRLRELEQGARALMPAVTAVARSVVDISFDALAGVVQMLTDSTRQERKVERLRDTALAQVSATLGRGRWEQALFDERFEASVERAADDLAGSLTRSVMWTVMTGRAAQLERRGKCRYAARRWKRRHRRCARRRRRCMGCSRRWNIASRGSRCRCWNSTRIRRKTTPMYRYPTAL